MTVKMETEYLFIYLFIYVSYITSLNRKQNRVGSQYLAIK